MTIKIDTLNGTSGQTSKINELPSHSWLCGYPTNEKPLTIGTKVCWTEGELIELINKVVDEDKPTKKAGNIPFLTPNQRKNLKDKIKALQPITYHKYWEISFHKEPVEHTRLWHLDNITEEWRYDSITGKFTSWQTEKFVYNKQYYIDDLLGEEE